jgi:DNA-binding MarR family transcriptional regulator
VCRVARPASALCDYPYVQSNEQYDQPLGYLLYRVYTALRVEVTAALEPFGLSLTQYVCLRTLSESPGLSSADIARRIGLTPQATNLVLRELEDNKLVTRPAHAATGRARPAKVSRSGAAALRRADADVQLADERLLGRVGVQQRVQFRRILKALGSDEDGPVAPSARCG